MFCVCLKFPYQHQIKKINPGAIPLFLKSAEVIARDSGCKKIVKRDAYFYFFDNPISSPFFTLRFLYSLSLLLKQVSNSIHESSVIVEYFLNEENIECLTELQNINLNFNCVLVASNASEYFNNYVSLSPSKFSSLKLCTSFSFFEDINRENIHNAVEEASLFFRKDQNYIQVLYNFILHHPIFDSDAVHLSKQEAKVYFETRCVLSFYSQNRFNPSLPKYFVDAFTIYAKLHIKIYKKKHSIKQITLYTDYVEENLEVEKLKQILKETKVTLLPKREVEIEKLPYDLLETIYIIIFSSRFIFYNEIEEFFFLTTETKAFSDLMKIMYESGIILQKDSIFSYQEEAIKKIEKKLSDKKDYFASFVSKYLWRKYKNAEITCDINLKKTLDLLKSQYNIAFDIDVFFNLKKHYFLLRTDENDLRFGSVDVIKKYENVIMFKDSGRFNEAFALTKELHSYFHNERILSGEYRSCSLLGFLFFEANNIGEALTYFNYSLEIAKKTKNHQFICEALCYLSIVYFLQKDFQNCSLTLQELSNSISTFFIQEWKVFYLFIQGRLFIELGEAKKASTAFKLAKDFSSLYFSYLEEICDIWYGRTLLLEGKIEKGRQILNFYKNEQALLFLLEAFLLFPKDEHEDVIKLKEKYDRINLSSKFSIFPFFEDVVWYKIYKQSTATRLFEAFYNYYLVMYSSEIKKIELEYYLRRLEELAMTSLYSKDNNASIYLYLSYIAQCKVDGEVTGKALGFLSKACNIMQRNTSLMYETSMRDKFMRKNLWNAKLFEAATENKLI